MTKRYKPGPGWSALYSETVYLHNSGTSVHCMGMLIDALGRRVNGMEWPEAQSLERCVAICGGNRKRGVMAWAMEHIRRMEATHDGSPANH